MTLVDIAIIYLAFRAKQLICDFFLQTSWMALEKGNHWRPLAAHAGIHAAFTFFLMLLFAPALWWLGAVDFIVHGAIDRYKAGLTHKRGWTPAMDKFWWALGTDQEAHNLTHLAYVAAIIAAHHVSFSAALPLLQP